MKYRIYCKKARVFEGEDVFVNMNGKVCDAYYDDYLILTDQEDFVVQMFTGRLDKAGKEIYEGDLVFDDILNRTFEVKLAKGSFRAESEDTGFGLEGSDVLLAINGNIFENV